MDTNQVPASAPALWMQAVIKDLQWPMVVAASFWVGRYVHELEMRLTKAESNVSALIDRHMPAIHKALAEIRGMLL